MASALQFRSQLPVIVDFAVENDDYITIFAGKRLVARLEIDDLQSRYAERDGMRPENAELVGTAMGQR